MSFRGYSPEIYVVLLRNRPPGWHLWETLWKLWKTFKKLVAFATPVENFVENYLYCGKLCGKLLTMWKTLWKTPIFCSDCGKLCGKLKLLWKSMWKTRKNCGKLLIKLILKILKNF